LSERLASYTFSPEDHLGLDLTAFRMLEIKGGAWTLAE
jgi:branched-chain amino acid transport system substrate-binding protein